MITCFTLRNNNSIFSQVFSMKNKTNETDVHLQYFLFSSVSVLFGADKWWIADGVLGLFSFLFFIGSYWHISIWDRFNFFFSHVVVFCAWCTVMNWSMDQSSLGEKYDRSSPQATSQATLQMTVWSGVLLDTCRIIMWCTWLDGSEAGTAGCTWVAVGAVVSAPVQSTLDVFLVFRVLVEGARFRRQQGHIMAERVQGSAVTSRGSLTQLLCYFCIVKKKKRQKIDFWPFFNVTL